MPYLRWRFENGNLCSLLRQGGLKKIDLVCPLPESTLRSRGIFVRRPWALKTGQPDWRYNRGLPTQKPEHQKYTLYYGNRSITHEIHSLLHT
jgi:hypothetical protein